MSLLEDQPDPPQLNGVRWQGVGCNSFCDEPYHWLLESDSLSDKGISITKGMHYV